MKKKTITDPKIDGDEYIQHQILYFLFPSMLAGTFSTAYPLSFP